ncbi:MFS transporter [Nocardiopsis ganjiahuensis]|uniref:MFS transporter n=1 Tax=Nocardiopsis ganjiahuensis TaxID=239984 RepID=UPI00034C7031|nr:MFS transporter [Nocardiopsis ganjiahuensis]
MSPEAADRARRTDTPVAEPPPDPVAPDRPGSVLGGVRRVYAAQLVGAVVDGAVLATVVLYFGTRVGLSAGVVGPVLAAASGCALVAAAPLGALADTLGRRRAAVGYTASVGVFLLVYLVADGPWSYAVGAVGFVVAQTGLGATRHALVAAQVAPERRVAARALMHTLLNAGMGVGTVVGALVLALDTRAGYLALYGAGAAVVFGCAVLLLGLPRGLDAPGGLVRDTRVLAALGDARLVAVTALTALLQLCMPVLSVILPLWLATRTQAPVWVAAVALGLNTVLVLLTQRAWSARVVSDASAARSAWVAGAALSVACVLFGTAAFGGPVTAAATVLAGIVLLTLGEVAGGPPAWHLALKDAPVELQGRYQSVFGMAGSAARILGSALALPLVLFAGAVGWAALGVVLLAAAAGLGLLARRSRTVRNPPR